MDRLTLTLDADEVLLERLLKDGVAVAHECGGKLACSTCLVLVRDGMEHLGAASEEELDMLERASVDQPGARLACQAVSTGGKVVLEVSKGEVPAKPAGSSPVSVTGRAAQYLAGQLARHAGAVAVRLAVEPAGCSGLRYRVDPAEAIRTDDAVFDGAGVRLIVDPLSLPHVQGTSIDLVRDGLAQRLAFANPNVRQSCGCGESFGT
jgi:iron-sulfur cluster assembly protein